MSFINKVVLITGAGSGIGAATALQFAKLSARLSLIDSNAALLNKSAEICEKISRSKVLKVTIDLGKDEEVKKAVENTVKEYGRIDVVVNCAEIFEAKGVEDSDLIDAFERVLAINLRSAVAAMHFAASALIESKGSIINISNNIEKMTSAEDLLYGVSKASLSHYSRCVALELSTKGVRVNSVLPSPVKEKDAFWANKQGTPLERIVKSEEIAELVTFLASEKAASITGASYVIDSGAMLSGYKMIRRI